MSSFTNSARQRLDALKRQVQVPDLATWRELAVLSVGIRETDALYKPMLEALSDCDEAYKRQDWPAFWQAAEHAKAVASRRTTKEHAQ